MKYSILVILLMSFCCTQPSSVTDDPYWDMPPLMPVLVVQQTPFVTENRQQRLRFNRQQHCNKKSNFYTNSPKNNKSTQCNMRIHQPRKK